MGNPSLAPILRDDRFGMYLYEKYLEEHKEEIEMRERFDLEIRLHPFKPAQEAVNGKP